MKAWLQENRYLVIFALSVVIISFSLIIRWGGIDLQPWDEGLYAVRVNYLLNGGNFWDHTSGSLGGLYSSSQPPLQIWLQYITLKLTGYKLFSLRFWPFLFYLGTLIITFLFCSSQKQGLFASLLLATVPFYSVFSLRGQLDMGATFFLLLALYFFQKYLLKGQVKFLFVSGVATALAFMIKMWMGILVFIPVVIYQFFILGNKSFKIRFFQWIVYYLIPLIILALPWHLFMYLKHGKDFLNYFIGFHVLQRLTTGVEQNTSVLGLFYFPNQLAVMLSAAWAIIIAAYLKKMPLTKEDGLLIIYFLWGFILFNISATKLPTYMIPLLPAVAIITSRSMTYLMNKNYKAPVWFVAIAIILALWASSQRFRDEVQSLQLTIHSWLLAAISAFLIFLIWKIKISLPRFILLIGLFLISRILWVSPIVVHHHQLQKVASYFYERDFDRLIYVDSKRSADDPLIAYYFQGLSLHPGNRFVMIRPENNPDFRLDSHMRNSLIIINRLHFNPDYKPIMNEIQSKAIKMFEDEMYETYIW